MTEIKLYNTRTRRKEPFRPLIDGQVRMYVCGPTVYDRAHIGNARPVVVFDVLCRLMRHVYGDDAVTYVRNFTDVDDKIIARAQETLAEGESLEAACHRITEETIGWYREDMGALGALPPTHEPRCTEYIPRMVAMIGRLIAEGCAYEAEGHVLFDVATYPEYGKLSRRSLEDMQAGARVEVAPYKRNATDFVLWKPSTPEQPGWESPWGRGRPGWHIECSAMAEALLGKTFDIHAGGIDLLFPHHENEVAQSCCANHTEVMANFWLHNGFLQVEGEKMAKSLGNFFTVRDLLDRKLPGSVIRFVLLSTNYRDPLDWTENAVDEAHRTLAKWGDIVGGEKAGTVPQEFIDALADDLNTAEAFYTLHKLAKQGRAAELRAATEFLGLGLIFEAQVHVSGAAGISATPTVTAHESGSVSAGAETDMDYHAPDFTEEEQERISNLLAERKAARREKNFQKADRIRDALVAAGVEVMDFGSDTKFRRRFNFDPAKLPELSDV